MTELENQITVEPLVASFLLWIAKHKKANSHRFYSTRLKPFRTKFGGRVWISLLPLEIDEYVLEVNQWEDGRPKSPDTCRGNVIALEQLQRFARSKLEITKQVIKDLEKPMGRIRDELPTSEQVAAIKAHSSTEFALVYQALRQSGARPNELARATVADWDRSENLIILQDHKTATKTGQPRRIAVGEKLRVLIEQGLDGRTSGPLFLTPRGKPWTSASLGQTFARARKLAGVPQSIKLYSARHEFATEIVEKVSLEAGADALGHKSIRTTMRYRHTKAKRLRDDQDQVNL